MFDLSSHCDSGCWPYQKLRGPQGSVAIYVTTTMPFFVSLVKWFSATLGCWDCVYEIFIVPTKLISNPVVQFLWK